jgi:hypothetical protein
MRLIGSPNPGDVERDTAVILLAERAVLTRAVCRELADSGGGVARRPCVALYFLLRWIRENLPESVTPMKSALDGTDQMAVPDGCEGLLQEIRDGAHIADRLQQALTADYARELESDEEWIREGLAAYWTNHAVAVRAPTAADIAFSGLSAGRAEPSAAPDPTGE